MKTRIISISWKNIWRNRTRSLVVIGSVVIGLIAGMLIVGIMAGWVEQRVQDAISNEISHIQIHNPDFMNNEEIQYTIKNYKQITKILDTMSGVVAYSPRSKNFAMVRSDWATTGIIIKGIDLDKERKISNLKNFIIEGSYFDKDDKLPSIVISKKTAETLKLLNYQIDSIKLGKFKSPEFSDAVIQKLAKIKNKRYRTEKQFRHALSEVINEHEMQNYGKLLVEYFSFYRLGAKITITISDTANNMIPITFRVQGIYKTSNTLFDGMTAFVKQNALLKETGFDNSFIHEIAIIGSNDDAAIIVARKLKTLLQGQSVLSWREIAPDLGYMRDMMEIWDMIFVGIILFALAFGIINTMLMAVLERSRELGMLMAIGMNKLKVFKMIMYESVLLTFSGAALGMIISIVLIALLSKTGINFSMWSEGLEAIGYSAIIYPIISLSSYIKISIMVIITGIIASLWPTRKALKLNPSEALRME